MRKCYLLIKCAGINARVFAILAVLFFTLAAFSQTPPPNDNYSNSITLTGTDITFSGTLAGATLEDDQETSAYYTLFDPHFEQATQSVWWNWRAPIDTVLTLEIVNPNGLSTFFSGEEAIAVYAATNGGLSPSRACN